MEEYIESFSLGAIKTDQLKHMVHTNSDHCMLDMILYTDIVSLGLDFMKASYRQYDIRTIKINNCEQCLLVGYILRAKEKLEEYEEKYIKSLRQLFQ
ncbi:hypothetical protein M2454_002261 [Aequitasia blattaphilus]|uniref:Uncharacterized protein n=1 Tax=Aequitasia blattaphilus TaxID=2949332 RepID=A0ABT1EFZ0_9FIRM|nr:hypothetical protein [Aequitasia blattaphilus]MCP1103746.1 hypothetical protein [Aequitasia blattaphilus]MCR8616386.1 hypothetical protein [Aequitasia blattaphilus]